MRKLMFAVAFTAAVASVVGQGQSGDGLESGVDKIFAKWTASTPGCAVGVAVGGTPVLTKAYGLADLEHDVRNTPDTIFEAGSVSKQFTAAAVLLLARDGKLSLDDPVRKHIPELPEYGAPLTIRHMLNHTSGLRDWGSVAGIAGWPRTTRVHTHAHVLEIAGHQRALNFPPGTRWSYSNTGFNLAAIIVSRVSRMPFPEFTRARIFEPLDMTHTSWRDDHTRVVKHRAIAYEDRRDGFHTDMPFETAHGNGGLLTTVGDLLTWNENFATPKVGDASFVAEQQQVGKFGDGRPHEYALGLYNRAYKGVRQVDHSGSTAGYRADLARYPDQHLSVAVLCNVSSGNATQAGRAVADLYLGDRLKAPAPPTATYTLTAADLDRLAGLYRHTATGVPLTISRSGDGLRIERGQADGLNPNGGQRLVAISASRLVTATGQTWEFGGGGGARMIDAFGTVDAYERVPPAEPAADRLKEVAGVYVSDEAETTLTVALDGGSLVVKRRPDTTIKLTPIYTDAFSAPQLGLIIFHRAPAATPSRGHENPRRGVSESSRRGWGPGARAKKEGGRVTGLSVVQDRVWDLRFARQVPPVKSSP